MLYLIPKHSSHAKVRYFHVVMLVKQQIFRLQIPMSDPTLMQVIESGQELCKIPLSLMLRHSHVWFCKKKKQITVLKPACCIQLRNVRSKCKKKTNISQKLNYNFRHILQCNLYRYVEQYSPPPLLCIYLFVFSLWLFFSGTELLENGKNVQPTKARKGEKQMQSIHSVARVCKGFMSLAGCAYFHGTTKVPGWNSRSTINSFMQF